ncbi:hypothetical protein SY26_18965 [Paracoccus sp. 228]|nr:hypothetical protein SY26_18965 [Paracoccus sp. 228]
MALRLGWSLTVPTGASSVGAGFIKTLLNEGGDTKLATTSTLMLGVVASLPSWLRALWWKLTNG